MIAGLLATVIALLVWGAHAVVPWLLRDDQEPAALARRRRAWRFAAPTATLLAVIVTMAALLARPDAAAAVAGAAGIFALAVRSAAAALLALFALDLAALFVGQRFDRAAWALAGVCGLFGLAAWSLLAELLRIGVGAVGETGGLALAVGCRAVIGLAAGRCLAPLPDHPAGSTPTPRRSLAGRGLDLAAGFAVPGYLIGLPAELTALLVSRGFQTSAVAAGLAFAIAAALPPSLARLARAVGMLVAAIVLAAAGELASLLPPPTPLWFR